jgi:hypothetical protein
MPPLGIDLAKIGYTFRSKPLLIGGKAMEHYGLRKAGNDIDFVVTPEDYACLAQKYPDCLKDLWGDLGVCPAEFEIWKSICLFDYDYLAPGALETEEYLIIALDKLLFLKALGMKVEKYHQDLELIVKKIREDTYAAWWPTVPEEKKAQYLAS